MKTCTQCHQPRPLEEFKRDKRRAGGFSATCKICSQAAAREWRKIHPETRQRKRPGRQYSVRTGKRYPIDRIKKNAAQREWAKRNPEKERAKEARRRYKIAGNGGHHTGKQLKALFQSQRGKCAVCRESIKRGYHRDHVRPVSRGGDNSIRNIQLLCKKCNMSKRAKDPIAWAREQGRLV